jgi:hypothetical protein
LTPSDSYISGLSAEESDRILGTGRRLPFFGSSCIKKSTN